MHEGIPDIRRRIRSVESTEHITNAMRLVSAARFRRARAQYEKGGRQLEEIISQMEAILAPAYSRKSERGEKLVVVMTGSRGLCGGYNAGVIRAASSILDEDSSLYLIGSKGENFFGRQNWRIAGSLPEIGRQRDGNGILPEEMKKAAVTILEEYESGRAAEVWLVYTAYLNTLKQEPRATRILPLEGPGPDERQEVREFEPCRQDVTRKMLPKYLQLTLCRALMEADICEHAARRTAMESATDNALDMLSALSAKMNRARQQAITDELIEIVSGAEALR